MKRLIFLSAVMALGSLALLASGGATQQQAQFDAQQQDVEPLTRGPVHEAFAELYALNNEPSPLVPKKPPEPIDEVPPDQRPEGDNVVWIGGYWAFDDERGDFVWVSGFWRDVPPEHAWLPGYWVEAQDGSQWVSGYWQQEQQQEVEYLPPPPEPIEAGPSIPAPSATHVYAPGTWIYREARYYWRPGFWVDCPEDWMYVPARYHWTPVGFVFCDGRWDRPLHRRGMLFTPMAFHRNVWSTPGWYWQPRYAVPHNTLVTALFARPVLGHYYFGDYFEPRYRRSGFVPWVDYTVYRGVPNAHYAYYRARGGRDWDQEVRQVITARSEGRAPRPPRTWNEQVTLSQNIANNNVKVDNRMVNQLTIAAPLERFNQVAPQVKLQAVSKEMINQQRQLGQESRKASQERQATEVKLARTETKRDVPARAKIAAPKLARTAQAQPDGKGQAAAPTPPPAPQVPKQVAGKGTAPQEKIAQPKRIDSLPRADKTDTQPGEKTGKPAVVQPKEEKKATTPPKFEPKEEKKATTPPKFEPKEEKKATTPPKFEPKEEKKVTTPPKLEPKEEKKATTPPKFEPKEEKKKATTPPKFEPKEEKKAKPPVFEPKEEKKATKPPVIQPEEKKVKPPVILPEEKKASKPPTIQEIDKARPGIVPPQTVPKGKVDPRPPRAVPLEEKGFNPPAASGKSSPDRRDDKRGKDKKDKDDK